MRNPTAYLKMRVLRRRCDEAEGGHGSKAHSAVSHMTSPTKRAIRAGHWRTISTWLCRYRKHGVTVMENKSRSDKGQTRKVKPEDIHAKHVRPSLPKVHGRPPNVLSCIGCASSRDC